MSNDTKQNVVNAVHSFIKKQSKTQTGRKNKSPEKDLQKKIVSWCKEQGWFVYVTDSSGQYRHGSYMEHRDLYRGHSDLSGVDRDGHGVFIEVKAPGKRSTIREDQRSFLLDRLQQHCFAVCVDSIELLEFLYSSWVEKFRNTRPSHESQLILATRLNQKLNVAQTRPLQQGRPWPEDDDELF